MALPAGFRSDLCVPEQLARGCIALIRARELACLTPVVVGVLLQALADAGQGLTGGLEAAP